MTSTFMHTHMHVCACILATFHFGPHKFGLVYMCVCERERDRQTDRQREKERKIPYIDCYRVYLP